MLWRDSHKQKKIKTKEEAPLKLGYRNVFSFSFTKNVSQSNILKVGLKRNNNLLHEARNGRQTLDVSCGRKLFKY